MESRYLPTLRYPRFGSILDEASLASRRTYIHTRITIQFSLCGRSRLRVKHPESAIVRTLTLGAASVSARTHTQTHKGFDRTRSISASRSATSVPWREEASLGEFTTRRMEELAAASLLRDPLVIT